MHALLIFHLGGVGGPSRSLEGLASWLAETGSVTAMFPDDGDAARDYRLHAEVVVAPYTALTYSHRPGGPARAAVDVARDVRTFRRALRRRPDVVVVATTALPAALIAARLERIPAVVYAAELYGRDWKRGRGRKLGGAAVARGTPRLASGLVCCSRLVAGQFSADGIPVTIAYPPIGAEYAAGERARGRARLGVEDADPCLAVVGNLSRGRGQDVALRAMPAILRHAPLAHLLVVGQPNPRRDDVAYAAELRQLSGDLGVDGAVTFAGAVAEMPDVYAAADVVVNPARLAESFGRVAAEALMAGRPPVATDVGAVREVIRDGVDGIVVPPERPDAVAEAVLHLWRHPELARRLVAAGQGRVSTEFGTAQDLAAWRSVLAAVLP